MDNIEAQRDELPTEFERLIRVAALIICSERIIAGLPVDPAIAKELLSRPPGEIARDLEILGDRDEWRLVGATRDPEPIEAMEKRHATLIKSLAVKLLESGVKLVASHLIVRLSEREQQHARMETSSDGQSLGSPAR
jgi:hypothetical protein